MNIYIYIYILLKEKKMVKFINPRTDYAFKKIFWSETSKDILISFLNAILDFWWTKNEIKEVEILDPYSAPKIKWLKESYLDVTVKTKWWKTIIIEMQVLNIKWFDKRVLYNLCKKYANQIEEWEDYLKLNPVIALTITDYVMFKELDEDKYISKHIIKEKDSNNIYNGDLELVFLELPKFKKKLEELESIQDKWIYFMREVDDMKVEPEQFKKEKAFNHAFNIASTIWLSEEELDLIERRWIFLQDQRWAMELAIETWMEKWIEKWRKEWLVEWMEKWRKEWIEKWKEEERMNLIYNAYSTWIWISTIKDIFSIKKEEEVIDIIKKKNKESGIE